MHQALFFFPSPRPPLKKKKKRLSAGYSSKVSSHGLQMKINKKMLALAHTFDEPELKRFNFVVDSQQSASVWIPGESIFHFISIPESTRTATASAGFLPQTQ